MKHIYLEQHVGIAFLEDRAIFLITNDHIFASGSHSDLMYCTKLSGTEGSFKISTHSLAKSADSEVLTKAFTLA
jgi:hypothetical protein